LLRNKLHTAFVLSLIGSILIIVNGLWIAANGSAIVLWSHPVSSIEEVDKVPLWGRIVFGVPGYVENEFMVVWIIFAVINLFCSILLCIQPKHVSAISFLIVLCSILSIPIGGGFILGSIFGILGGFVGAEWPKPMKETFVGRLLRALRLDASLFKTVSGDPKYLREALLVLIIVNVLSGLGYGLYSFNIKRMEGSAETRFNVLLLGKLYFDTTIFYYPITYMSVAFLKWLILGLLIYLIGVKLGDSNAEYDAVARVIAFAYTPIALQILTPLIFTNQPIQWPLLMFLLSNIWMTFALVIGIKQALDLFISKALGIVVLAGGIYWIIDYLVVIPFFEIEGSWFILQPISFVLTLLSVAVILALLLGVLTKR